MALTNTTFLRANGGRLSPAWYPGETLTDLIDAWITIAEALTTDEAAQTAYVYHLGFTALADSILAEPAHQVQGPKTDTYAPQQLDFWVGQARHWRLEYDRLTGAFPSGPVLQAWAVAGDAEAST